MFAKKVLTSKHSKKNNVVVIGSVDDIRFSLYKITLKAPYSIIVRSIKQLVFNLLNLKHEKNLINLTKVNVDVVKWNKALEIGPCFLSRLQSDVVDNKKNNKLNAIQDI